MSDFEVTGADEFLRLSKALKQAGETDLRKALHKGMREGAKPLAKQAQARLEDTLPSGLRARGGRTKVVVKVKTGKDPGVTLGVPFGKRGAGGLGASNARLLSNQGKIRHPVFGNREVWRSTDAPSAKDWFDRTMREGAPRVRPALEQVLQDIAEQIVKEAR